MAAITLIRYCTEIFFYTHDRFTPYTIEGSSGYWNIYKDSILIYTHFHKLPLLYFQLTPCPEEKYSTFLLIKPGVTIPYLYEEITHEKIGVSKGRLYGFESVGKLEYHFSLRVFFHKKSAFQVNLLDIVG